MAIVHVEQKIKKPHENIMGKHMKHKTLANADFFIPVKCI
jgi:hypothetical protein